MDISNLSKNLSKGLEQKSNAELTALSRVLDIALGKVTIAQVTETIPVTPEERQALLNKTAESLAKLANNAQLPPAAKEEVARLLEQQAMIKSPDLKWINLLVNNRQLLTYSDKPLAAGQAVTVRLAAPEKLVLLDLDLSESDSDSAAAPVNTGNKTAPPANSSTYSAQALAAQSLAAQSHTAKSIPASVLSEQQTPAAETSEKEKVTTHSSAIKNTATATAAETAKIHMAVITETAPITAGERQELLKKTTEELQQLGKMAQSIPGLKEAVSVLLQQQALIKSPATQWIHLALGNQALLTYSDKPLTAGQPIAVQVVTPQKIVLIDLPEIKAAATPGKMANGDAQPSEVPPSDAEILDSKLKLLSASINSALAAAKNLTPTYFARLAAAEQKSAGVEQQPAASANNFIASKNIADQTGAAPAKIHTATVTDTAPLLSQERNELLKKTGEELTQLRKLASSSAQAIPGLKEAVNSLLQQQTLIRAPATKWIHLQVGNQPLLTYSDKPLASGQTLPVQVVTPQKILLLDPPETGPGGSEKLAGNPTPTYFAKLSAAEAASISDPADVAEQEPDTGQISKNTSAAKIAGKIEIARVTETAEVQPEERTELLKKTGEELIRLNKIASSIPDTATSSVKEAIASIVQQQALIKSPDTKWVHLSLNNQSLLTYSDKPLMAGQTVPVQQISGQKIVLLEPSDNNLNVLTESIDSVLTSPKNATPTYFAKLALAITEVQQSAVADSAAKQSAEKPTIKNSTATSATTATAQPKIQLASVTQTLPITAEERQELLNKTSEELLQLNKMPNTTPGLKEAITSLLQQQALIKSPEAKWVHLQLDNQSLLTYSNKPLTAGQTLAVQVITPQKILLLDQTETKIAGIPGRTAAENLSAALSAQKNSTPTYFATLAPASELSKSQVAPSPIIEKEALVSAASTNTKIELATVIKATPVNAQQRQQLLQKITGDLQQITKLANTSAQTIPSAKELIASLLEQEALAKSPNLKWLELSVNNRALTTFTDKSVSTGQTIPLQVATRQSLAILETDPSPARDDLHSRLPQEKTVAKTELPDAETESTQASASPGANQWQYIPETSRLTAKTLEQALKSVAEQIRSQLLLNQAAVDRVPPRPASASAPSAAILEKKSLDRATVARPENTANKPKPAGLLKEIDQLLKGETKKLSTELTAKLLQELVKGPTNAAAAQTPIKAAAALAERATYQLQTSADSSQDIEQAIEQLLNKSASDTSGKAARAQLLQLMQYNPETVKEMDISKLTQHLSKNLEQKNNAELSAISRALNITLGKVVMADVAETAPVTAQERKELLAKTAEALTQLNKLASNPAQLTPANKAAISQLLEQQALIQSPQLKWANLVVNNRPILTYTDKPLSAGQAVPVQLVDAQKLVLLNLPDVGTANNTLKNSAVSPQTPAPQTMAVGANANPTYSAKLATTALQTELEKNLGAGTTPQGDPSKTALAATASSPLNKSSAADFARFKQDTPQVKQVVADNLRRLLPYKDTPSVLLEALTQWQKLPAASQQRLVPVTVEQALKSLAEQIRSPLQIIQPKVLAQIIKHSGIFFENALSNSLTVATDDPSSTNAAANNPETGKPLNPAVAQTFHQDLKGSLLTLLSRVNQELTGSSKPLSEEQTIKLLQQLSSYSTAQGAAYAPANFAGLGKNTVPVDIGMFIQQVMSKPVKELSDKELRNQLLTLLQQHSVHSLAKIQLQQLASLNSEVATRDTSQTNASWQIEIPVRHHNEVQQLQLRIDREWVEEKHSSGEEKTPVKVKQWSVTLKFDLPTLGEFCAQLAIIDTSVSATLWASEERTFGRVRKQIEDLRNNLEKEGINVKQLQCMKGMPAAKPMALSYSLIDIST